ncbi:MAG: Rieske 2Fe-2S domain-containing protein [Prochloraceae cyanobacterium]|nr:Rieske 2Fe-2S domain-containing protein [Prochloraceae cyanobacterium]
MTIDRTLEQTTGEIESTTVKETSETFEWTKQWYPVAVVEFLDPSRPHSMQLLGKDIVLWRDNIGEWNCFEDFCPHRLVPFSEGRVESDGTLLCAYHAWRFNSQGKCVSIPQSKDKETEAKNCENSRSRAMVYPTQVLQGLLWVWGESGETAQLESQLRSPRIIPELEDNSDKVEKLSWNVRDLPYGWDFFMENVSDPAHAPVSHHGIIGNRYSDAKYYDMLSIKEMSAQEGFAYEIKPTSPNVKQSVHDFQPPCHMRIFAELSDGGKVILALYAIPTRPGWCRHIGCQILVKNQEGKKPKGLFSLPFPMPTWFAHIFGTLFLHQDSVFLHYQEKILAKQKNRWLETVYTPNPQDKMVIALRNWIEKRAGGGVPWASECDSNLPPVEHDKSKLFDVWTTHTKNCTVCQDALKNFNRITKFSFAASVTCLFLAIFLDSRAVAIEAASKQIDTNILFIAPSTGFWLALGGAIILAIIGYFLNKFARLFLVYEFHHADNH